MTAVALPSSHPIIQVVNEANLGKIESFLNDTAYREAIENSSTYNSRLCRERRLRMPFLDSQTGVAQNHSNLFMSSRERLPGLQHGQIYTYPSKRWRKKRRQYLMHYMQPKRGRGDLDDGIELEGNGAGINDDSKESAALKDEHSKDAWYYDEQDMLDMDVFEEQDQDSDYDYEESYSSKRKRRRPRGAGHHPARSHPPATDSPGPKRTKGGGRGRKKANYDAGDADKPFVCDPPKEEHQLMAAGSPSAVTSPGPVGRPEVSIASGLSANPANPSTVAASAGAAGAVGATTAAAAAAAAAAAGAVTSATTGASSVAVPNPGVPMPHGGGGGQNLDKKSGKLAQPSPYCDFCLGDARENKKTGGSEELVSCSDCGRSGKIEEKIKRKYSRRANHN